MHDEHDIIRSDNNTITLYALRDSTRRIAAIKMIRALGPLFGGHIGLAEARTAVDNLGQRPLSVTVPQPVVPIVRLALEIHFTTYKRESIPLAVASLVKFE